MSTSTDIINKHVNENSSSLIDEELINNFYYLSAEKSKFGIARLFKIPLSTLHAALHEDCYTYHIISEPPLHLDGSELLYLVHYLEQPKYFRFYPTTYKIETSKEVSLFIPIFLYEKQLWIASNFDSLESFKSNFKVFTSEEEYNKNLKKHKTSIKINEDSMMLVREIDNQEEDDIIPLFI